MSGLPSITARYAGECPECGVWWQPGEHIRASGNERLWQNIRWRHVVCPDSEDPTALRRNERVCETCWLVHPEGQCDR